MPFPRSAANFDSGNYEAALEDMERTLGTEVYPRNLHYKLHLRRALCLKELGRRKEAQEALLSTKELLTVANMDAQLEEEKAEEVRELIEHTLDSLDEEGDKKVKPTVVEDLQAVESPHLGHPALSSVVEVAHSPSVGRHLLATRDIAVGEVVGVEEAAVCRLLPLPGLLATCHHCLLQSWAPLPCYSCAAVTFCSQRCREAATYHRSSLLLFIDI